MWNVKNGTRLLLEKSKRGFFVCNSTIFPQETDKYFFLLLQSNIVVTGVPTKDYRLPSEWVQEYTTVVNVASFKNVDEESLLKIKGVVYVPMVGKVTVAMLERNLVRLFEQFHVKGHPRIRDGDDRKVAVGVGGPLWYGQHPVQWYTAAAVTVLLAMELLYRHHSSR